jgi:hypothetical protein
MAWLCVALCPNHFFGSGKIATWAPGGGGGGMNFWIFATKINSHANEPVILKWYKYVCLVELTFASIWLNISGGDFDVEPRSISSILHPPDLSVAPVSMASRPAVWLP